MSTTIIITINTKTTKSYQYLHKTSQQLSLWSMKTAQLVLEHTYIIIFTCAHYILYQLLRKLHLQLSYFSHLLSYLHTSISILILRFRILRFLNFNLILLYGITVLICCRIWIRLCVCGFFFCCLRGGRIWFCSAVFFMDVPVALKCKPEIETSKFANEKKIKTRDFH